ncbi:MAG: hypothetical protein OXF88_12670 [Rhodobacteraceae bacterium]|nr:hypothetical protein [Paracoccaceae bacterium]
MSAELKFSMGEPPSVLTISSSGLERWLAVLEDLGKLVHPWHRF